ncbi:MAG: RagB/SusD family nutrient uptake outer membrane protein [Candidatus Pedobacter colombiensis]|uniref:RagB/SusD family nutrient uptake outer membrane protein n=1 Tax=Candidatus Pedobacter colombiensis TaxID=3121371 RepID=A0AAJ5W3K1_9SPHI|nr:RagB/SusD family nutrient uptake outer membrane protein [Pedobacter sp.]WEK17873.1 MAG: RagB/SusD family nutrient uptake outer membrane protein [Pedobacter sp.]
MILIIFMLISTVGCKKFLDEKPNQQLVVPSTIKDLQSLLDDQALMNQKEPNASIVAADNYSVRTANWISVDELQRNMYVWSKENQFVAGGNNAWVVLYSQIYKANIVLDNIKGVNRNLGNQVEWDNVKGQALFIRAKCFLQGAFIWTPVYNEMTNDNDLGLPLRLDPNFNVPSQRASVKQTYFQVLEDLKQATSLLPVTPIHVIRPSKPAAFGLLARTYLAMGKPDSCLKYANLCLQLKNKLMDYNGGEGINVLAEYPFMRFNPEVIYDSYMGQPTILYYGNIDKELYDSYSDNDLRKKMYHRSSGAIDYFKGSYSGTFNLFNGVATDEVYLMRAECFARLNDKESALTDLNTLISKRWKVGQTYVPFTTSTAEEALILVLNERRKELVFRGLRWMDIKRLNKLGANITLKRSINGQDYSLPPNDLGYAMPIPEDIILISGMKPNPR